MGESTHCFLLVMYGFCWNNVLYITILSFIFLLTAFDTKGCYYFESNLSLVLLIKVSLTKKKRHVMQWYFEALKNDFFSWISLKFSSFHFFGFIETISSKNVKSEGFGKKIKWRLTIYIGVVYRRGVQTICTPCFYKMCLHTSNLYL